MLVAAILAPTDPVLASDIQVNHAGDDDRLRYAVSGEAGLNDGIAFPFVIAALLLIGQGGGPPGSSTAAAWTGCCATCSGRFRSACWWAIAWAMVSAAWPSTCGRGTPTPRCRPTTLALALIALSYVGADALGGWGLASFAAGIGLRHAEVATLGRASAPAEAQAAAADVREAGQASGAIEYGADRSEHRRWRPAR